MTRRRKVVFLVLVVLAVWIAGALYTHFHDQISCPASPDYPPTKAYTTNWFELESAYGYRVAQHCWPNHD